MNLKTFIVMVICFMSLISCRENREGNDRELNTEENEFSPVDRNIPRENVDENDNEESKNTRNDTTGDSPTRNPDGGTASAGESSAPLTGQYIKLGHENDSACGCYCIDLNASTAELCIIEGEMYINTRLQKNSNNTIDIFLVEPAGRNIQGKDIPWKDFDRTSSIATIKPSSKGEVEFDWLGFKINGDIAVDYAILGKKTLEGNYKKK